MGQALDYEKIKVWIGTGTSHFRMKRGSFQIKDSVSKRVQLIQEEIEIFKDSISIHLSDVLYRVNAILRITKGSKEEYRIELQLNKEDEWNRIWIGLPAQKEDKIYGCGETFTKLNLRGQKVRIWVAEHQNAKRITKKIIRQKLCGYHPEHVNRFSSYESYYVAPTFVIAGNEKQFVHVDGNCYMQFDFTHENTHWLYMHKNCTVTVGKGITFEDISKKLADLIGHQKSLPEWIYDGVILGMQRGTKEVEQRLQNAFNAGVKVAGIWCQDWEGCRVTKFGYQLMWNWVYDASLYPDLGSKIREWKEQGIHFLGYINPFLAIEKELYAYASKMGYCVKDKEGNDYKVTITTFPAAMVDFTNPAAYEWIKGVIKENMIGLGMDGWMADFGEYLPTDCVLYSKENPKLLHNCWPAIWAKINYEALEETNMVGKCFFFTRAGYTESVRYSTMMWNGDQHVDDSIDDGLPSTIPATLSLAMSGYGITHSDVGGYTTILNIRRDKEIFLRWMEMNVFSPLLRTHEGNQPEKNIQFDSSPDILADVAYLSRLHKCLKPYLIACVDQCAKTGTPVMRPLFYHYEEAEAYEESYEYLLGRDILVAPVLKKGEKQRKVYLPEDNWIHMFTEKKYWGGIFFVDAPMKVPAVFIREDSLFKDMLLCAFRKERE